MTILIGGQHNVVFFGPRSNPRCQRWWADRGLLHMEDSRDNLYKTVPIPVFVQRLKAVSDMIGNSKATLAKDGFAHIDEIERQQRFVEEGIDLLRIAKEQGEAGSSDAIKEASRRRSLTLVMPDHRMF